MEFLFFEDLTPDHEIIDRFLPRKNRNFGLARAYMDLGLDQRAQKVLECGSWLEWRIPEDLSEGAKLSLANFCKDRLCAMCSWRRTLKIFGQVSQVMDRIQNDYEFVFVTLTLRSCSASDLKSTLNHLQRGFYKFSNDRSVKAAFKGYFKALEITRHTDLPRQHEYHPHLHCIFAVTHKYFKGKDYISHDKLVDLWQRALGIDYPPIVDIRKVRPDKTREDGEISLGKAVAEVAKYSVKTDDYLVGTFTQVRSGVSTLLDALTNKRLCSFGGIFKKIARELDLDDMTEGDLVHVDGTKLRSDVGYIVLRYQWQVGIGYQRTYVYYEKENTKS